MQGVAIFVLVAILVVIVGLIARSMSPKEWGEFGLTSLGCGFELLIGAIWTISIVVMLASLVVFLVLTLILAFGGNFDGGARYFLYSLIILVVSTAGFLLLPHLINTDK